MKSFPSCWNRTLAQLGFRRRKRKSSPQWHLTRRSLFESLEAREMLSGDPIIVNTLADSSVAGDGRTSLREALVEAYETTGSDDIVFAAGLFVGDAPTTFYLGDANGNGQIDLGEYPSELIIDSPVTIQGQGVDKLIIDASHMSRVFHVTSSGNATISNLSVVGGSAPLSNSGGGGLLAEGSITLDRTNWSDNTTNYRGGAIYAKDVNVSIMNSTLDDNYALANGGAIYYGNTGNWQFNMSGSTVSHNEAGARGNGLIFYGASSATTHPVIENTTISQNTGPKGGAVYLYGPSSLSAEFINSTIVENYSVESAHPGGLWAVDATSSTVLKMYNTILAGNTSGASDHFSDMFVSSGSIQGFSNLLDTSLGPVAASFVSNPANINLTSYDEARLAPLGDYGGPTHTHALLPGSLAIDHGSNAYGGMVDQRGFTRGNDEPGVAYPGASATDIGAVELSSFLIAEGDFDGDRRADQLRIDPTTGNIVVVTYPSGDPHPSVWGNTSIAVPWPDFQIGDFNGDGRDDVAMYDSNSSEWTLAISDGNQFFVHNLGSASETAWSTSLAGDVDGDGEDELVGWDAAAGQWQVLQFNETFGSASLENWGTGISSPAQLLFLADANRDGRADLITSTTPTGLNGWHVNLSQESGGTGSFATEAGDWSQWFNGHYNDQSGKLNADEPYQEVLDIFSEVYNNFELEFYPGLMKGPEATEETMSGNAWDLSALLVEKLEATGIAADIATGWVTAPVTVLKDWIGSPDTSIGVSLRDNIRILLNQLGIATLNYSTSVLRFQHVWVEATVPTEEGFMPVFLDSSWKFKNRHSGILSTDTQGNLIFDGLVVPFNQLDYLSSLRDELALEYYEGQLMDHLAHSFPGKSLADVPYDGPIRTREFTVMPAGMGDEVANFDSNPNDGDDEIVRYDSFDSILTDQDATKALTHRVILEVDEYSGSGALTTQVVVPESAFQRYTVTTIASSPIKLVVQGSGVPDVEIVGSTNLPDGTDPGVIVTLRITHLDPGQDLTSTGLIVNTYSLGINKVTSIGLDADQYSPKRIEELQEHLLSELATIDPGDTNEIGSADIDDLLNYSIAAYWYDFNRDNETIAGLTSKSYSKKRVGSGIATADVTFEEFDHLNYRMAPDNMGVDLKNWTGFLFDWNGEFSEEALRLEAYNGSGLEHTIVEETIGSESISTVKGLQRAFQQNLGIDENGQPVVDDKIHAFDSYWNPVTESREIHYRGVISKTSNTYVSYDETPLLTNSPLSYSQYTSILSPSNVGGSFQQTFYNWVLNDTSHENPIRVLVPDAETKLNNWTGNVYVLESVGSDSISMSMTISPEPPHFLLGGYTGGLVLPKSTVLPKANFTYAAYTGDPVNTANGNMFRDDVDIVFPNLGVPLDFTRHYDSQNKEDIGMGVGWTHSLGDVLFVDPEDIDPSDGENLIWLTPTGERHKFETTDGVNYTVPSELHGLFSETTFGGTTPYYYYRDRAGAEYAFQKVNFVENGLKIRGSLTRLVDNLQNGVALTYSSINTSRKISKVIDVHDLQKPSNQQRALLFNYANNHIASVTKNVNGQNLGTWDYAYDTSIQHLKKVESPQVAFTTADGSETNARPTLTYDYYTSGYGNGLISKITELHDPSNVIAAEYHTYEYYPNGRVFRVTDSAGHTETYNYNLIRGLTEFTDENGNVETYIHQENGLLKKQIHDDRTRMEFTWGKMDTPAEFLMATSADEAGAVESFKYYVDDIAWFDDPSAHGIDVGPTDFRDRELYEANEKHFPDKNDPLITRFDYFKPGYRQHMVNLKTVTVDPDGQSLITTNDYDNFGRLIQSTDPLGNVTTRMFYADTGVNPKGGLVMTETGPRGNDTSVIGEPNKEYVFWEALDENFHVDAGTLSVRVEFPQEATGKYIVIDAIRIDRVDGDFPLTRVIDEDSDGINNEFDTNSPYYYGPYSVYYGSDRVLLSQVGQYAVWNFDNLETGTYRISATWNVNLTTRWNDVHYELYDGPPTGTPENEVTKDQTRTQYLSDPLVYSAGFMTTFEYDAAGYVTEAQADGIPATATTYDHFGNVKTVTDPAGIVNQYVYDALGRRTSSILIPTNNLQSTTSTYSYDAAGRLRFSIDPLGNTTEIQYDERGNVAKQILADDTESSYTYDGVGNRTTSTDPLGRKTEFKYDSRNRLIETIYPDGTSTRVRYNAIGQVAETTDERGNKTSFSYDAAGRLLTTTNAENKTATNHYNQLGQLDSATDFNSDSTFFYYDDSGRLEVTYIRDGATTLSVSTNDYDAAGNLTRTALYDFYGLDSESFTVSEPSDWKDAIKEHPEYVQVTEFRYDALNRPIETIHADGTSTRTVYDNTGRILYQYDEMGRKTKSVYDDYGRLQATILPDPDGSQSTTPSPQTLYSYDSAGNQTKVIDPNGNATEFVYDKFNRVVTTVDSLGKESHSLYDVAGQMVASIDTLGRAAYTKRDERGRVVLSRAADPDGTNPLVAPETHYVYDEAGNIKEEIDPLGRKTTYAYDDLNRLVKESLQLPPDVYLIDNGDPGYSIVRATLPADINETIEAHGYLGDTQVLQPKKQNATSTNHNAIAQWNFDSLPAGTYEVYATWDADAAATDTLTAVYWLDGSATGTTVNNFADQRREPEDVLRDDDGTLRYWEIIPTSTDPDEPLEVSFTGDGPHSLTLWLRSTTADNLAGAGILHADAVRLEREQVPATRSYTYDNNGNLLTETDTLGDFASNKRVTSYEYDALGRVKKVTLPDPDGSESLTSLVTNTYYDAYGNVDRVVELRGDAAETGSHARTTKYTYDERNRVRTEILDDNGSAEVTTKYEYDAVGNLKQQIEDYDPTDQVNHVNTVTKYDYDDLNRQTAEMHYRSEIDTHPLTTRFEYDANGNLLTTSNEVTDGSLTHESITLYEYDTLNRQTSVTHDPGGSLEATTRYSYDAVGNLLTTSDPLGHTTTNEYDRLDRLKKVYSPDPDGNPTTDDTPTTSYTYDALSQLLEEENGEGEINKYAYDTFGNLIRSTDGEGHTTVSRYDSEGNFLSYTDPEGNTTTYTYDDLNRITTDTIKLNGVDVSRIYTYNPQGNLYEVVDRDGRKTRYNAYDRLDRILEERWYDPGGTSFVHRVQHLYDKLGREIYSADLSPAGAFVNTYEYDDLGRVTKARNYLPQNPSGTMVPKVEQSYAYDVLDSTDANQFVRTIYTQRDFDGTSTYTDIGETTTYTDRLGRTAKMVDTPAGGTDKTVEFTYDDGNRLTNTHRTAAGGFLFDTIYAYDNADRVKGIEHYRNGDSIQLTGYFYTYDKADRIRVEGTTHDDTIPAFADVPEAQNESFTFDKAGQLTIAHTIGSSDDESFTYDANGNRISTTANGTTARGDYNRLDEDADWYYDYDNEGNLTNKTRKVDGAPSETEFIEYFYDHRNRLARVDFYGRDPSLTTPPEIYRTLEYAYDASDELVSRRKQEFWIYVGPVGPNYSDPSFAYYVNESGERVLALDNDQDLFRRYTWGTGRDQLLTDEVFDELGQVEETLWAATDHLGSVRDLLDSAGDVANHREYDAFGELDPGDYDLGNPPPFIPEWSSEIGYTGKPTDIYTGLQINSARWYDPHTGRFLGEDPIQDGSNWYAYAGNDPINYRDPTGLSPQGNPLNNLFGGYSGGKVAAKPKPVTLNTSLLASPTFNSNPFSTSTPTYSASQLFGNSPSVPTVTSSYSVVSSSFASSILSSGPGSSSYNSFSLSTSDILRASSLYSALGTPSAFTGPGLQSLSNVSSTDYGLTLGDINSNTFDRYQTLTPSRQLTSVRQIGGQSLGDMVLGNMLNTFNGFVRESTSPAEAFSTQLSATVTSWAKGLLDVIGPASTPSYERHYSDGSREITLNGEPTTGALANQALVVAPFVLRGIIEPSSSVSRSNAYNNVVNDSAGVTSQKGSSLYVPRRYSNFASEHGAYWEYEKKVFPTQRNSGLVGERLRAEQQAFFERGLNEGKSPGYLRGQAARAGYRRDGGLFNSGGPDRLAAKGAENALQRAIQNVGVAVD